VKHLVWDFYFSMLGIVPDALWRLTLSINPMKRTLSLIAGLLTLSLLPASAADAKTYPAKSPVLQYEVPAKWTSEVDPADGDISISSDDERISIDFGETEPEASMEVFKVMLQAMVKEIKDAKEVEAPKEHTSDGLTGYTATYTGTVEDSPVVIIMVLFQAGKDRSIIANFMLENPATLPKEQNDKFGAFMKSLKAVEK
jgi:hypothetical protein